MALFGVWAFYPELLHAHAVAGLLLIGSWIVEIAVALIRYRRLSNFHTYLSKAAAYLLGISIGVLFLWGLPVALLYVAVTASVAANLEELALMWLLPQWRPTFAISTGCCRSADGPAGEALARHRKSRRGPGGAAPANVALSWAIRRRGLQRVT